MGTWVKPAEKTIPVGMRLLSSLNSGEVWSLNEKSRKFTLVKMADAQATVIPVGSDSPLDLPIPGDQPVMVHPQHQPEMVDPVLSKEYTLYDRVCLCGASPQAVSDLNGTVIDINNSKFPDIDIVVLWDAPLHGNLMSEVHPHEVRPMGCRVNGEGFNLAKQAREFLKSMQDQQHDSFKQELKKEIVSASTAEQERQQFKKEFDQRTQELVGKIAQNLIETHASEFKRIMEAGTIMITAGSYNYEVDRVPEFVNNYAEWIYNKASLVTHDEELKMPATIQVLKKLASSIMDTYTLIRHAYIRPVKSRWGVFSEKGKLLGKHDTKKEAVQQLKAIEFHKNHRE